MAYEGAVDTRKGKRDQLPRRGQVKAMVVGVVVRSLLMLGSKKGSRELGGEGREQRRHGEDLHSSSRSSPTGRRSSEAPSDGGAAGPSPLPSGHFIGSAKSLDVFVVEAPLQVL